MFRIISRALTLWLFSSVLPESGKLNEEIVDCLTQQLRTLFWKTSFKAKMLGTLRILNHSFRTFLDKGDPRVQNWPLMQTPFPGMAMIAAYIYFVKVAGPQFMKKRKAYDLRKLMAVYNFLLVFVNLWVFLGIGKYGYFSGYTLCQSVDYSNKHEAVGMAQMGYLFYLTKFVEFADTIFFVLRKKDNQISALHVIHHSIVPFSLWFGIKFAPGGYNAFFPFLNSFVHVIMYTYYGLAAMGEKFQKYLFWKKYMTYIQLMQFVGVIIYAIALYARGCNVPPTFIAMNFIHALLFFGLFLNFFVQNYIRKSTRKSNPTLVPSEKAHLCSKSHDVIRRSNENGYKKLSVSEIDQEVSNYRIQFHRCTNSEDCNLNCRASVRKGSTGTICKPHSHVEKDAMQNGYSKEDGKFKFQ